jgi:hypothetical protein
VQGYVTEAIATGDDTAIGLEIHALADSFSHASFVGLDNPRNKRSEWTLVPAEGHAQTKFGGHEPDLPFNDVPKALKAAEAVYDRLRDFAQKKGLTPTASFQAITGDLTKLFNAGAVPENKYDHDANLAIRIAAWQTFLGADKVVVGSTVKWRAYNKTTYEASPEKAIFEKRAIGILENYKAP